jgi:hypothetical protein
LQGGSLALGVVVFAVAVSPPHKTNAFRCIRRQKFVATMKSFLASVFHIVNHLSFPIVCGVIAGSSSWEIQAKHHQAGDARPLISRGKSSAFS